jgi:hypothetical protein
MKPIVVFWDTVYNQGTMKSFETAEFVILKRTIMRLVIRDLTT